MKKFLLILVLIPIIAVLILLSWPEILINKTNILWVLQREEISNELSWDSFEVDVTNRGILKKEIRLQAQNLCGSINEDIFDLSYCLSEADINIQVGTAQWPFVKTPKLSKLVFEFIKIHSWPKEAQEEDVQEESPIKIVNTWKSLWKLPIPKLKLSVQRIEFPGAQPVQNLSLDLQTTKNEMKLSLLGVHISANKREVEIQLEDWKPTEHITLEAVKKLKDLNIKKLNIKLGLSDDHLDLRTLLEVSSLNLNLRGQIPGIIHTKQFTESSTVHGLLSQVKLNLNIKDIKTLIDALPKGAIPEEHASTINQIGGSLESELKFESVGSNLKMDLQISSILKQNDKSLSLQVQSTPLLTWQWPLETNVLFKKVMIGTKAQVELASIKKHLSPEWKKSFDQLPSPLNNFNGPVTAHYEAKAGEKENDVEFNVKTVIKLKNGDQKLFIEINPLVLFDTLNMGIKKTDVLLHFTDVRLKLPHINLSQAIPQVGPDSRISFQQAPTPSLPPQEVPKENQQGQLDLKLTTPHDRPIRLSTNLLSSDIYIDLNLEILDGLPKGNVTIRPLETTLFKREIQLKKTVITLSPNYSPILETEVHFPLPNYLIILKIDGPVDEPRPLLSSRPPLPEDDIISVLLFGQPLSNLPENEQAGAANKTSQILSQGLLSLSVLYFLSDTPIQSIGVDPETQKVSAQIGLDDKSSLQLSTQEDGTQTVGIRRSIGKGWFIDTSVQKSTLDDESEQKNYGVLLERIISY